MVSCLIFKSLSHFEFIFVNSARDCSNIIDLKVAVKEEKRKNTIVFCVPNVNQLKNIYEGKNQILNRSFVL